MRSSLIASLGLAALASAKVALPLGWFKIQPDEKIKPSRLPNGKPRYLSWMADSQIKHGVEPTFAYTVSAYLSGILLAHERTGDEKYRDYVKRHADMVLYPAWNGDLVLHNNSNSIDDIRFGHTLLDVYNFTGAAIYKTAADSLKAQIDRSFRTPDGGFYHRYPVYIDQMWLDGIYMLDVFYARWTQTFQPNNNTAWDDIALQFDLIDAGTTVDRERTNGLPLHGFDVSKNSTWADPETGAAPHVWGRAVGWYVMALVDTLDYFPASHPGRARLIKYFQSLADAVIAAQDPVYKGWYNIMDPGLEKRDGNYIESSGSAMFVYGLLKGVRLGYLGTNAKYLDAALSGYELMTGTFAERKKGDNALVYEWTVQTGSLSSNGTFEYYASIPLFENDLKGVAPFLFSSYEYELYLENKSKNN
ncbi:putative six-hairpin glycosidase superfamily, glycosyl hydrolase, family 88 [Septoria linicola]|nr:putative six-hairpin glycosidase superfamily, glycosyl hydrolase, family 88 [Septoria linicola]